MIFVRSVDPEGYPFNSEHYASAYLDLLLSLKARGAKAYFATDNSTYVGRGVFTKAYTTDSKVPVEEFELVRDIKADLVFEKGGFVGAGVLVLNPEFVHRITSSKLETYKYFAKYQPRTVICANQQAVERAIEDMPGELVVVKEPVSNRGQAVQIGKKAQILHQVPQRYPIIVQEFIDTSVGIKGYVEGIHDVRIKIAGGEVLAGMIRTPAPGEYRANLAQGGTARHLYVDEIPPEAFKLAREIDCYFEKYPRYYAIDFAYTANGWKLIELNSKPGFAPLAESPQAKYGTEKLADYLIKISSPDGIKR